MHRALRIDFKTFLEIIGVCQHFRGREGDEKSTGFSELSTPSRKVKRGEGRRSRSKVRKDCAEESQERGVEMSGAFCRSSLEFLTVRGGHPTQGKEMLAFSHFGGLDAPTS